MGLLNSSLVEVFACILFSFGEMESSLSLNKRDECWLNSKLEFLLLNALILKVVSWGKLMKLMNLAAETGDVTQW